MQNGQRKGFRTKARTKRLIELGALFDIANLGHHDPATLVGMLSNVKIASDDPKWTNWHKQGFLYSKSENRLKTQRERFKHLKLIQFSKSSNQRGVNDLSLCRSHSVRFVLFFLTQTGLNRTSVYE